MPPLMGRGWHLGTGDPTHAETGNSAIKYGSAPSVILGSINRHKLNIKLFITIVSIMDYCHPLLPIRLCHIFYIRSLT